MTAKYLELSDSVGYVEVILSEQLLANSINATNWVEGTVFVYVIDDPESGRPPDTTICDPEQSRIITDMLRTQEYGQWRSFPTDLWVVIGDEQYYLSSATGEILRTGAEEGSATLSADALQQFLHVIDGGAE